MELYIHFGIYKTGSSFLQYACATNRNFLIDNGYYFPLSNNDLKMESGEISSGNAGCLHSCLATNNKPDCLKLLKKWVEDAKKNHCGKILISAESLIHLFATDGGLQSLVYCSKKTGIEKIEALGFFRDLVGHALSTYKHRAKSGAIGDFSVWLNENYETPNLLVDFFDIYQTDHIKWTFKKYKKDSSIIIKVFFNDWLGIDAPNIVQIPTVNESLTLSEILLVYEIGKEYGPVLDYFVKGLRDVPLHLKANNSKLEQAYRDTASSILSKYNIQLLQLNDFFEDGVNVFEQLENSGQFELDINQAVFSKNQLEIIVSTFYKFNTLKGKVIFLKRRIAKLLPKGLLNLLIKLNKNA